MRVIIAGSKYYNDYDALKKKCIFILRGLMEEKKLSKDDIEILGRGRSGVDRLGISFANEMKLKLKIFELDHTLKSEGVERDDRMVAYALEEVDSVAIIFYDNNSTTIRRLINKVKKNKMRLFLENI